MLLAGGWCNLLAASCPSLAVHACARARAAAAVMQQAGRPAARQVWERTFTRAQTDGRSEVTGSSSPPQDGWQNKTDKKLEICV